MLLVCLLSRGPIVGINYHISNINYITNNYSVFLENKHHKRKKENKHFGTHTIE